MTTTLDSDDFQFSYEWRDDGRIMHVYHLSVDEAYRGSGVADFIIETLSRIAYYELATVIEISIGGGERSERFLEKNGFYVYNRREYEHKDSYGVDAVRRV